MSIAANSDDYTVPTSKVATIGRDVTVRASSSYRLDSWESLPEAARAHLSAAVAGMVGVSVLVGVPGSGLPAKLVDDRGGKLFAALSRPGSIPDDVSGVQVMGLVLDAVLEVEWDGEWVSGPLAYEVVLGPGDLPEPTDRLSRLSYQAVTRADRMPLGHVDELCARLYGFGRLPVSRRWMRAYPGPKAVATLLDLAAMERDWIIGGRDGGRVDWLSFSRRGGTTEGVGNLTYKLYVSPHVDALPAVLVDIAAVLAANGVPHFKIGAGAAGLLRPDKIVVYLVDASELHVIAHALAVLLDGVRPHGVPFSAELAGDGLLSWGGDPPVDSGPVGGGAESWRLSVCRRLAEHLAAAKRAPLRRLTPTQYALGRLATDGVTLPSFAPASLPEPGRLMLVARYQTDGDAGLEPRSRRPRSNPHRTSQAVEEEDRRAAQTAAR